MLVGTLLIALLGAASPAPPTEVSGAWIYHVQDDGGRRDFVSLLPPARMGRIGLPGPALLGVLRKRLDEGGELVSGNFVPNAVAVDYLQSFIARTAPTLEEAQSAARAAQARGDRWLNYIDGRTRARADAADEDRIGTFDVVDGAIRAEGWRPNRAYRLVSDAGILTLDARLHALYVDALAALSAGATSDAR